MFSSLSLLGLCSFKTRTADAAVSRGAVKIKLYLDNNFKPCFIPVQDGGMMCLINET